MTSDRALAYGRIVKTLEDLSASKLLPGEQERIRDAADTLLFCDNPAADEARGALTDVAALARHLTESGRWLAERARQLAEDVTACGPFAPAQV